MRVIDDCYNIADLREAALRRLPKCVFEFVDRGTEDEVSLAENVAAFRRLKLRTKFMVDLTGREMSIELFGKPLSHAFPDRSDRRRGALLAPWRGGARQGRRQGGRAVHADDDVADRDRTGRARGRRPAVVPGLHVGRDASDLRDDRAGARSRRRGPDHHHRHRGGAQPGVQPPQRLHRPVPHQPARRRRHAPAIRVGCWERWRRT